MPVCSVSFVCLFICLFVYLFIYLFVCSFVRWLLELFPSSLPLTNPPRCRYAGHRSPVFVATHAQSSSLDGCSHCVGGRSHFHNGSSSSSSTSSGSLCSLTGGGEVEGGPDKQGTHAPYVPSQIRGWRGSNSQRLR
eukprot:GHVU01028401.1.p5 GENE.GHVU01028401.1~~GHVU01028401.1.p5  ORF type:complete len:136 (+),score=8.91 GHVU01028401.1:1050-1457(+)